MLRCGLQQRGLLETKDPKNINYKPKQEKLMCTER